MSIQSNALSNLEFLSTGLFTFVVVTYANGSKEGFAVETSDITISNTFDVSQFCLALNNNNGGGNDGEEPDDEEPDDDD